MEAAPRGWLGSRKTRRVPPWRGNGQDTGQVTLAGELWNHLAVLELRGWCCLIFQTFPSWKARRLCQQLFHLPCFLCFSLGSGQGGGVALAGEKWHGDQSWLDEMQMHFLFPSLKSPSQQEPPHDTKWLCSLPESSLVPNCCLFFMSFNAFLLSPPPPLWEECFCILKVGCWWTRNLKTKSRFVGFIYFYAFNTPFILSLKMTTA